MNIRQVLICFLFPIAAVSCQPVTEVETELILSPSPTTIQLPTESPNSPNSNLDHLTQLAIADLTQRLELDPNLVTVIETKPITWPDASLGCPQAGLAYAQVLTPGFFVRLEANGQIYEYHTDMLNVVAQCDSASKGNSSSKNTGESVQDGWPNQTKDRDVIIVTPTPRK